MWLHYEECIEGEWVGFRLTGEIRSRGYALLFPPEHEWDREYPVWTHGRRDVIIERIRHNLPRGYYIPGYSDNREKQ